MAIDQRAHKNPLHYMFPFCPASLSADSKHAAEYGRAVLVGVTAINLGSYLKSRHLKQPVDQPISRSDS